MICEACKEMINSFDAENGQYVYLSLNPARVARLNCEPSLPSTRDNSHLFHKKESESPSEFPEFSDDLDFFDAENTIEV